MACCSPASLVGRRRDDANVGIAPRERVEMLARATFASARSAALRTSSSAAWPTMPCANRSPVRCRAALALSKLTCACRNACAATGPLQFHERSFSRSCHRPVRLRWRRPARARRGRRARRRATVWPSATGTSLTPSTTCAALQTRCEGVRGDVSSALSSAIGDDAPGQTRVRCVEVRRPARPWSSATDAGQRRLVAAR